MTPPTAIPQVTIDLGNVQALVQRQYREQHSLHLLFQFGADPGRARALLGWLVPRVTWASVAPDAHPPVPLNLGITYQGLRALGVGQPVLDQFPQELPDGPVPSVLGDYGSSAPDQWWNRQFTAADIHLCVHLFSADLDLLKGTAAEVRAEATRLGHRELLGGPESGPLAGRHFGGGRLHFGFRDGISSPDIGWDDHSRKPDQLDFRNFLLGYSTPETSSSPHLPPATVAGTPSAAAAAEAVELVRDGTYGVLRWLSQDVAAFNRFLAAEAPRLWPNLPVNEAIELLAAKLMGRWRDGAPLILAPTAPNPDLNRADTFDYAADPEGLSCPLSAHIRVANPRGTNLFPSEPVPRPRLIRRGTPYGLELPAGARDDGKERGLIGLFLCASIRSQFYTITHWMQRNDFSPKFAPNFRTQDPFANRAVPGASPVFRVPGAGDTAQATLLDFTRTRGTAFFLLPGRAGLARLTSKTTFPEALHEELKDVNLRRGRRGLPPTGEDVAKDGSSGTPETAEERARQGALVGLALSGGGIRSATFCLGVLQGLAKLRLLGLFDYLSTVSGGGYVGGWLAAWIKRRGFDEVERGLRPVACPPTSALANTGGLPVAAPLATAPCADAPQGQREAAPLKHLRRYGNYLAPRLGAFSSDGWTVWAIYLRNFLLNQFLLLLPGTVLLLLLSRAALYLYHPRTSAGALARGAEVQLGAVCEGAFWLGSAAVFLCWLFAFGVLFWLIPWPQSARPRRNGAAFGRRGGSTLLTVAIGLLLLGATLFCALAPYDLPSALLNARPETVAVAPTWGASVARFFLGPAAFGLVAGVLACLACSACFASAWRLASDQRPRWRKGPQLVLVVFAVGFVGGAALYGLYRWLHNLYVWHGEGPLELTQTRAVVRVTTFGPLLVLLVLVLVISLGVGLYRGRHEDLHEWWAAVCGRLLRVVVLWFAVNYLALYGTVLVLWAGGWLRLGVASGWLLTVAGSLWAATGSRTGGQESRRSLPELLARIGLLVFLAGLVVAVSLLIHAVVDNPPDWKAAEDDAWPVEVTPEHPPTHFRREFVAKEDQDRPLTSPLLETQEYDRRPDEQAASRQAYWLGLLQPYRTTPTVTYVLNDETRRLLREAEFPENVLANLQENSDEMPQSKFRDWLDHKDRLPGQDTLSLRVKVIDAARRVQLKRLHPDSEESPLLGKLVACAVVCLMLLGLGVLVDVNRFSLHGLYRNRLARAYLGASREPGRAPNPETGLDSNDDGLNLSDLRADKGYDGPFLIVNTALNLAHGDELAWQERKAASFPLTPVSCGWRCRDGDCYRRTTNGYGGSHGLSLGTAVTISGAAVSPNSGYHSSLAVSALLTVFNARLGAWLGNPHDDATWNTSGPSWGLPYLLWELLGLTDDRKGYVYLSDGGHFENLGAYELIRRRCRYVVLCDADQDPEHAFDDLGGLIRKCRVDFGINIEMDLESLRLSAAPRRCRWHCAVGRIRYDEVHQGVLPGTLVYLKPSLTGDEPADVLHYAVANPDFPHQTTSNQFFNESQFESYRALGLHVAEAVFKEAIAEATEGRSFPADLPRADQVFAALVRRWFAMPPEYEPSFVATTQNYIAVQEQFRQDVRLRRLTLELYPELTSTEDKLPEDPEEGETARRCGELHGVAQMLQAMENAWLSLKLDVHYAHPLNRGWMDVFHRWMNAPTVRRLWPLLRSEFAQDFVRFCERQMQLGVVRVHRQRLEGLPPRGLGRLLLELEDVLPQPEERDRNFHEQWQRFGDALDGPTPGCMAWLLYPSNSYPPDQPRQVDPAETPCGVLAIWPLDSPPSAAAQEFELVIWLRGAYRNSGLGRDSVSQTLAELATLWPTARTLLVRLPMGRLTGPGGELQRRMWLTFFHQLGFAQVDETGSWVRMKRKVGGPTAGTVRG